MGREEVLRRIKQTEESVIAETERARLGAEERIAGARAGADTLLRDAEARGRKHAAERLAVARKEIESNRAARVAGAAGDVQALVASARTRLPAARDLVLARFEEMLDA
jgi:V/A-type H+-transporting ATPase subunit G/H